MKGQIGLDDPRRAFARVKVLGLADRIPVMKDGRISGELSRAEATEEKILTLAISDLTTTAPGGQQ